ncbi:MAG TPA: biotin--[acetyl-CoA-carboxylase] ligase [Gemmatimonadales bacterium]|jgi:BirA family biotin operon repressor/biotin-[acetyl-CoA-carboxylase] ligase
MPPELIRVAELPSTMESAHALALDGAEHGTTVVAGRQLSGRGTRGRSWSSEPGGLWLSVVARPSRTDALEALSLRVGLAVAQALEAACPALPRLGVKWPNDIVIDGRKLAGILCEARWGSGKCQWVIVGLGLNVRNVIPDELQSSAVALSIWDATADPVDLAAPIAAAIAGAAREAGPLSPPERAAFALRDALAGARVSEPVAGTAAGITPLGALQVRSDIGTMTEVIAGVVAIPK